jgi:hypothetical protein
MVQGTLGFFSNGNRFDNLPLKASALGKARIATFLLQLEWYRPKVAVRGDGVAVQCPVLLLLALYVMLNGGDHLICTFKLSNHKGTAVLRSSTCKNNSAALKNNLPWLGNSANSATSILPSATSK